MLRHAKRLTLLAALAALCSVSASAYAGDASGTWKWTFERNDQKVELSLELKQDGEKLTGTLNLPFGDGIKVEVQDGTIKDDELSFKTVLERNGNSFETKYKGKLDGDTIKGTTERERNGETVSRDWEAKREKK